MRRIGKNKEFIALFCMLSSALSAEIILWRDGFHEQSGVSERAVPVSEATRLGGFPQKSAAENYPAAADFDAAGPKRLTSLDMDRLKEGNDKRRAEGFGTESLSGGALSQAEKAAPCF